MKKLPMLKFTYVIFLAVTSLVLFLFSKEKDQTHCKHQASGAITLVSDSSAGNYLGVVTKQGTVLRPISMDEEVVLAAGQHVTVCYNIDSTTLLKNPASFLPVHIIKIDYQP